MAKSEKNLTKLSEDELLEYWTSVGEQVQNLKEELNRCHEEHQNRLRGDIARRMLDGLDNDQRAVLAQEIKTQGVVSEEVVNGG